MLCKSLIEQRALLVQAFCKTPMGLMSALPLQSSSTNDRNSRRMKKRACCLPSDSQGQVAMLLSSLKHSLHGAKTCSGRLTCNHPLLTHVPSISAMASLLANDKEVQLGSMQVNVEPGSSNSCPGNTVRSPFSLRIVTSLSRQKI
jgi:hypothetical protein